MMQQQKRTETKKTYRRTAAHRVEQNSDDSM